MNHPDRHPSEDHETQKLMVCFSCNGILPLHPAYCIHCGTPSPIRVAQQGGVEVVEEKQQLHLDQLAACDYLLIQTRNSIYKFTPLEAAQGYGLLSGGALGSAPVECLLIGAWQADHVQSLPLPLTVEIGLSVLFLLNRATRSKRVATSPVTRLTQVGGGRPTQTVKAFSGQEQRSAAALPR